MRLHEILQFAAATIPIVAVIWRTAEMKNQFYKYVDRAIDNCEDRLTDLEKRFAIHKEVYEERRGFVDYQLHGLDEKLDHKFQRLANEIKDLKKQ